MTTTFGAGRSRRQPLRRTAFRALTLAGALTLALPANSAWAAPFARGDFEVPVLLQIPGVHGQNFHTGEHIGPWRVDKGDCDLATAAGSWAAASGRQSVDLNGFRPCSLVQTFDTEIGQDYLVSFAMAGNVAADFGLKTMNVFVGSRHENYVFDTRPFDGVPSEDLEWDRHELRFTATGLQTTLRFTSTTPRTWHGPAIDDVTVEPVDD